MKKIVLSMAAVATVASASMAGGDISVGETKSAAPVVEKKSFMEVYGKANVFVDMKSKDDTSTSAIKSEASRFGLRGSYELSDGLFAIYQWETAVDYDTASDALSNRDTFVGLKGNIGTLLMGIHDTPMKQAQGKVDLFNDVHDMKNVIGQNLVKTEVRADKILVYSSPKFSNIQFNIATAATDHDEKGEELGKALSTSLVYGDKKLKKTSFYAALAYDKDVVANDATALRVVLSAKIQNLVLGALAEKAEKDSEDQMNYLVSAAYKLDKTTLKLQHVIAEEVKDVEDAKTQTSFGIDYKIGKKTKLFVVATKFDVDNGEDEDYMRYSAGIVHKFSTKF